MENVCASAGTGVCVCVCTSRHCHNCPVTNGFRRADADADADADDVANREA